MLCILGYKSDTQIASGFSQLNKTIGQFGGEKKVEEHFKLVISLNVLILH